MSRDLELHYRDSGNPDGPCLVFLHGLFASLQNWQSIVKLITDKYRIINIDLPNHGSSPHTPTFTFDESVEAIVGLLERLKVEKSSLVGHSLGGKISMLIALRYPEIVNSLLVEDIAPKTYPPWFSRTMITMQELNLKELTSRKEADEKLSVEIPDHALRAFLLTNLQRSEDGFKWRVNLEALISGGPNIAGFPQSDLQYEGPTLFVGGGDSPYIQETDHELIQNYFPNALIEKFEGADHWLHARQPENFSKRLKSFLN